MPQHIPHIEDSIKQMGHELGFDAVRIARAHLSDETGERLDQFVELERHGDMGWMAARRDERRHPRGLWADARSIIMVAMNYGPDEDPLTILNRPNEGAISVYAKGRDYHDVLKKRLKQFARRLIDTHGGALKVFVDTAPVMEKPLAQRAGIGWQGKHTNVVSTDHGSWLFLGSIFTTLDLVADIPETDHCGSCQACLDIYPTKAFPAPYQLDARKCISYLTIEHKGHIPSAYRKAIGNRIYGCDDCLAVCPWNKFAHAAKEAKLKARDALNAPSLRELSELDDTSFRAFFSGSPVKRTGRDRFIRNVMIAIGNSGNGEFHDAIKPRLADPSPLVRVAAVWAAKQLFSKETFSVLSQTALLSEKDAHVRAEWTSGISGTTPG